MGKRQNRRATKGGETREKKAKNPPACTKEVDYKILGN